MESTLLEKVIMGILTAIIGIAFITQGLIPMGVEMIGEMTGKAAEWSPLMYLVITVTVLALVAVPLLILVERNRR